ncbi:MAG: guanylate kinase, partial [Bacteroidetes bacterium HGW-Bacteroidetes-22]
MAQGKLIVFSAPSGAGKTSVVRAILNLRNDLSFSVSACSRGRRPGEVDGRDYYFLTTEEFRKKIEMSQFLEWEEVYPESFYGTLLSEIERIWAAGKHVVFDVDVVGALNIKKKYPQQTLAVFIAPPSMEILADRLRGRGTETEESIASRLGKAEWEMTFSNQFDYVV